MSITSRRTSTVHACRLDAVRVQGCLEPATLLHTNPLMHCRATLVVCPVSLMGQWASELADKSGGRLRVLSHHGPKRSTRPQDLVGYDVVLVTYQLLAKEAAYFEQEGGWQGEGEMAPTLEGFPCSRIKWHRLVLDESHTAKNPKAGITWMCAKIESDNRWACLPADGLLLG